MNKLDQRQKAKAILSKVSSDDFLKWNQSISKNLSIFLRDENLVNKVIGGFAPIIHEPVWSMDLTKDVLLAFPAFKSEMIFKLSSFENLEMRSDFGVAILGPKEDAKVALPDVILVPGLSFTQKGERLGRGKGFYDRYLESFNGVKIGLCYECQVNLEISTEAHDQKMNIIITEKNIYRIRS
jgi:5-formyltetrahydrofolate cyclo-ligase